MKSLLNINPCEIKSIDDLPNDELATWEFINLCRCEIEELTESRKLYAVTDIAGTSSTYIEIRENEDAYDTLMTIRIADHYNQSHLQEFNICEKQNGNMLIDTLNDVLKAIKEL